MNSKMKIVFGFLLLVLAVRCTRAYAQNTTYVIVTSVTSEAADNNHTLQVDSGYFKGHPEEKVQLICNSVEPTCLPLTLGRTYPIRAMSPEDPGFAYGSICGSEPCVVAQVFGEFDEKSTEAAVYMIGKVEDRQLALDSQPSVVDTNSPSSQIADSPRSSFSDAVAPANQKELQPSLPKEDAGMRIGTLILLILCVFVYFLPVLQARSKGHLDIGSIAVINIFFGWTVIGWFVALIWSCSGNTRTNRQAGVEITRTH
jgi:hypothetical protein